MKYFGTITDPKDLVNKEYIDNIADTKANIDGAYENMTVGNAEQLVSTVMVNDQEPYIFRTSGGSADIGDREYDTIVGGSLPWNQLGNNGDFSSGTTSGWTGTRATLAVNDGTLTVTATDNNPAINHVTNAAISAGHKILVVTTMEVDEATTNTQVQIRNTSSAVTYVSAIALVANSKTTIGQIFNIPSDVDSMIVAVYLQNDSSPNAIIYNQMVIDLTQLFGTEIADYIYSLEQSNAGDGAAWFRRYFPDDYYAYNPGNSLLHVQGLQSHNTVGFNAYNPTTSTAELFGGNQYQITGAYTALSYTDISGDTETITPDGTGCFTPVSNGTLVVTGGDNTTTCVHLTWDGERNGEYEPYKLNSYPLDSTITLRGVPKLDANNKLYYDGDRYLADGTVDRRYGIVDLGTLTWINTGTSVGGKSRMRSNAVLTNVKPVATSSDKANIICSKYITVKDVETAGTSPNPLTMGIAIDTTGYIRVYDPAYDDGASGTPAAFKTAMSGVYLVYELDSPTTETADPYQSPQIVDDWGAEEYIVTLQGDVAVPVGHDTNYANNLRAKLEMAPESPSGDGDYIVRQTSGQNAYVPLVFPVDELPVVPSEDGSYTLQVTISGGTATYSWVSA